MKIVEGEISFDLVDILHDRIQAERNKHAKTLLELRLYKQRLNRVCKKYYGLNAAYHELKNRK